MSAPKKAHLRNSTAEFLVFTAQAGEIGIEVRVEEQTVWLTQKLLATLFDVDVRTISEHLQNLFASAELTEAATLRNFRTVQTEGSREVARNTAFYNLDAIIAVGFRVNSTRATQFRQWAIGVLRDFALRGYARQTLEQGWSREDLTLQIKNRPSRVRRTHTRTWAAPSGLGAWSAVSPRALPWAGVDCPVGASEAAPRSRSTPTECAVLTVTTYAVTTPMARAVSAPTVHVILAPTVRTMSAQGNALGRPTPPRQALKGRPNFGASAAVRPTAEIAKTFAESEFEKYRVVQDRLFESDFDRMLKQLPNGGGQP